MAAKMLTYQGELPITLAFPGRGNLEVVKGDKVDGNEWPGLADRPDFVPVSHKKKPAGTGGASQGG